ncbi:dnaJ-like subfamily B member 14-like, partial [Trifolium medium]|nr:dnaJ-like subfamily B member 14-like [Trifolium medium]
MMKTSRFLGVPSESSADEIKVAFRKLSKEYHPDTTSLP